MHYRISKITHQNQPVIATECPHCGHAGTFQNIFGVDSFEPIIQKYFGSRKCPNPKCMGHIFVIIDATGDLLYTVPSRRISFDSERIPERIKAAFDEALVCQSNNCFISSAIMIRKTLEEICVDKETKGDNLFKKIENLKSAIVLPKDLIEGMHELRLLGNDAAHIEAQTFEQIGKEELEISIEFTKELLKAVYQYESLLEKLRSLKKQ